MPQSYGLGQDLQKNSITNSLFLVDGFPNLGRVCYRLVYYSSILLVNYISTLPLKYCNTLLIYYSTPLLVKYCSTLLVCYCSNSLVHYCRMECDGELEDSCSQGLCNLTSTCIVYSRDTQPFFLKKVGNYLSNLVEVLGLSLFQKCLY